MGKGKKTERRKELETILVIVLALVFFSWLERRYLPRRNILLGCALFIGAAGLAIPLFSRGLHWAWMGLSKLMGAISGRVLLTVAYILVLMPLSFFARLTGKLSLRLKRGGGTYFKQRDHLYCKEDMIHPW